MILDHKKRFRESQHRKLWHEATASDWFQSGLQAALLEMQKTLPEPQEMGTAAANEFRMKGAQKLVYIMLNLTETTTEPKPRFDQNLNHNA